MNELLQKLLKINGLTEEDLHPRDTLEDIAENAYIQAQYNAVLLELLMEDL